MNKNCQGCMKVFDVDISVERNKKFCSKQCYGEFLKKKYYAVFPKKVSVIEKIKGLFR